MIIKRFVNIVPSLERSDSAGFCPFPAAVGQAPCSERNLLLCSGGWFSLCRQFLYFPSAKPSEGQYPDHKVNRTHCAVNIRTISLRTSTEQQEWKESPLIL